MKTKNMFASDLHLRSEQCYEIILIGYPYEKKKYTFKFGADLRVNKFLAH